MMLPVSGVVQLGSATNNGHYCKWRGGGGGGWINFIQQLLCRVNTICHMSELPLCELTILQL